MEMNKAEQRVFLDRASRTTRGKRLTKLVDDEIEEDEQFWNQDALKEEVEDTNYQEEGEAADVFDSDFDEDEPDQDEAAENEPDDRVRTRKRLIYPGHPVSKKKQKKKVISALQRDPRNEQTHGRSTDSKPEDMTDDLEVERSVRKSTRTSVIVRQAERDAIRAAVQATMKPIKRKKEGEEKRMTQEEMLLEAAQTEIMNLRNLERVLAREEEVKKRAVVHKAVYSGPQIRYLSKEGCSYLEFRNGASFRSEVPATSIPYSQKAVCAVTGLPAKYRDPKTGLPYATKEAFKIIRERASHENNSLGQKYSEGDLCDLLADQGFSRQRKRSVIPNSKDTSSFRLVARFRRFSTPESQDSE
ncbi:SWR1 complex subunit 2 [Heracleum sosnowskyi]|uniref:SWR1 complex subunit 2 n=1 Tax=Heracleum sosnowskyi TaxID=360622 RepID=A0AAD8JH02_9APIA|nr:SWR1 complex subunit 2 [Heracleum sosnowskyi]